MLLGNRLLQLKTDYQDYMRSSYTCYQFTFTMTHKRSGVRKPDEKWKERGDSPGSGIPPGIRNRNFDEKRGNKGVLSVSTPGPVFP